MVKRSQNKSLLVVYKLFFGLLGLSAVITEIATIVERGNFVPANFFSYFTIESNILVLAVLLLSALAVVAGKNDKLSELRGSATVYILIVGLGFSFLLSGLENAQFTAIPWDNLVLHYIMPVAMFGDWLLDRPTRKLSFVASLVWLVFPTAYVGYSLIRGQLVGWYPYPFLNPTLHGYASVAVVVVGMLMLALALTWVVCRQSGKIRTT